MVFCPMRILPCEPGMHACDMPLHQWFHVEPRVHHPLPVASIFDNDSDGETLHVCVRCDGCFVNAMVAVVCR